MKKVLPLVVAASLLLSTATSFAEANENATGKFLEKKFNVADSTKEFKTIKAQVDELGYKHERVQQIVNGIPVYGSEYIVHYDAKGNVYSSDGKYDAKAKEVKALAKLTSKDAVKVAKEAVNYIEVAPTQQIGADRFSADLYLYDVDGTYVPTYIVKASWLHENTFGNYVVFVNAESGEIIRQYDNTQYTPAVGTGVGVLGDTKTLNTDYVNGTYYLRDLTRGAIIETLNGNYGTTLVSFNTDPDNNWDAPAQAPAVDAHYYVGKTYDYYKNVIGRNGIDNANKKINSIVHYGRNYVNAFWNGTYLVFGDGDGIQSLALSGALDIVAHEYSHGVTEYTSGLVYQYESGSLSESFSDVMAVAVEKYAQSTKWDWLMGEDVWTPATPGDALRSLADPTLYGDPDHISKKYTGTADNGGVHTNSGIPNHAAYTMGTNFYLGVDGMAKVFYRANMYYYGSNETFAQAKTHTLQAAADLYGPGSAQYNAVAAGWAHVGL